MVAFNLRWHLQMFATISCGFWIFYAVLWWLMALAYGDLGRMGDEGVQPCIYGINSFITALIFSMKSQQLIGYGYFSTSRECPAGVVMMFLQALTGFTIYILVAIVILVKIVFFKNPSQTLMFSRNAVVCLRNGKMCIMWRVCEKNKSNIIRNHIRAHIIRREVTREGESSNIDHVQIQVRWDNAGDGIFMTGPAIIMHEINEGSPFFIMSSQALLRETFELVVAFEGTLESTRQSVQASTTFLPTDILWGRTFEKVIICEKDTGIVTIDYTKFNDTYEVATPLCCASEYYLYRRYGCFPSPALSPGAPPTTPPSATGTTEGSPLTFLERRQLRQLRHRVLSQAMYEL